MRTLIHRWIETRRAARRVHYAVLLLRKEAASMRVAGRDHREFAKYLDAVADLIEGIP